MSSHLHKYKAIICPHFYPTAFHELMLFLSFILHFNTRIGLCNQIKFWCLPHLPVLLLEPCEWFLKEKKPVGACGLDRRAWPRDFATSSGELIWSLSSD